MTFENDSPIGTGKRFLAMFLDHLFMTMIAVGMFVPALISSLLVSMNNPHDTAGSDFMDGPYRYVALIGFALYFCKDVINGRSVAKRILTLQVVDNSTGEPATPMQCFVRNLFCALWIVEVFVAMANTSRRIGDRVADTRLVHYDQTRPPLKTSASRLIAPLVISYLMMLFVLQLMPSGPTMQANAYSETSYNQGQSKRLENLITDSLGQYLTPDVRIYDTVQNESYKYVSAVLNLKADYLQDHDTYNTLNEMALKIIYSTYPRQTFTGQLKFVYSGAGNYSGSSSSIGTFLQTGERLKAAR